MSWVVVLAVLKTSLGSVADIYQNKLKNVYQGGGERL